MLISELEVQDTAYALYSYSSGKTLSGYNMRIIFVTLHLKYLFSILSEERKGEINKPKGRYGCGLVKKELT
jgi:hypothetical protein